MTRVDWLLENARVRTMDPHHPFARAVAVGGGKVLALGTGPTLRRFAGPGTERVDCRGATVLPGLVDPHLHLFALAARHAHLDCAAPDLVTLLARVRTAAHVLAPGVWVRGDGLDERALGRLPTAAELDGAAPRNPVRLQHRSLHASVLSGLALRWLGDGPGIERRRGRPTGLVSGRESAVGRLVGPLPETLLEEGLVAAARELAAFGLTTVADATPRARAALAPLRDVMAAGAFPLRVHAMRPPGSRVWPVSGRLHPGAVKIVLEEDRHGPRPRPAVLGRRIAAAAAAGAQVAVHCIGVASLVATLVAFAAVPRRRRVGRRHRLEHVAECPTPLVARIAALGLMVVTNPAFIHHRGDAYRAETGGPARAWLYRARTLAAAGVPLAGASDAPVVPASPWVGIAAARTRRTASGAVLGGAERLDALAALRLFTTGAAFALGDDTLGRLVPGGPADLVVVEPDPLRAPADEVAAARVLLTLVAGGAGVARVKPFMTLRYEKRGAVACVTLDRPEVLNAYDVAMRDDLYAVLGAADEDPDVRALVLRGRGRAFSSGGDLREFGSAASPLAARDARWRRDVWGRLLALRAVTVAAVHGWAAGGGMEMALLCDVCVAADDACFMLPETGLGMIPGVGGTQTTARHAGLARALELVLTGRRLDARVAHAAGLVARVVPRARLEATSFALARRLATVEPGLAQAVRRCVRAGRDLGLDAALALERRLGLGLERAR